MEKQQNKPKKRLFYIKPHKGNKRRDFQRQLQNKTFIKGELAVGVIRETSEEIPRFSQFPQIESGLNSLNKAFIIAFQGYRQFWKKEYQKIEKSGRGRGV